MTQVALGRDGLDWIGVGRVGSGWVGMGHRQSKASSAISTEKKTQVGTGCIGLDWN